MRATLPLLLVVVVVVAMMLALGWLTTSVLLLLLVLRLLAVFFELVFCFRAQESAGECSDDAMTSLVSKRAAAESAGYRSHETAIALLACSRIGGAILALLVGVRVVGVLRWGVLVVSSLLRELVRWIARWVLAVSLLLWRGRSAILRTTILAVLESTVGWSAVLLVVLIVTILVAAIMVLLVVAVLRWGRTLLVTSISLLRGLLVAILALVLISVGV